MSTWQDDTTGLPVLNINKYSEISVLSTFSSPLLSTALHCTALRWTALLIVSLMFPSLQEHTGTFPSHHAGKLQKITTLNVRQVYSMRCSNALWDDIFYKYSNKCSNVLRIALHRQSKQTSGGQFPGMESCKYSEKSVSLSESEDTNDGPVNWPVKWRVPMIRGRSVTRLQSSAMKK